MWKAFILNYVRKKLPELITSRKLQAAVVGFLVAKFSIPETMLTEWWAQLAQTIVMLLPIMWWIFAQAQVDKAHAEAGDDLIDGA